MKNVVFWSGVKNEWLSDKYGGWDWMDCSRKSWEYWCKQHDVVFFPFEKALDSDLKRYRINFQRYNAPDLLDEAGIDYDQVAMIDCAAIVRWDTPNFFELTDHKFTGWRDIDNMRWIYDSIKGYEEFFDFKLDGSKYINCSPTIWNKKEHADIIRGYVQFYKDNTDALMELHDVKVKKGFDQTPLNYWLQKNGVELKIDLPMAYKLTHIHRKEMFGHNWQLNENKTPFFIKYGYLWYMQGFPKEDRNNITKQIWGLVEDNYKDKEALLDSVVHKDEIKSTTSRQFKSDVYDYFSDDKYKEMTALDLGCWRGHGSKIYSHLFKKVYSVEIDQENVELAKDLCISRGNIVFECKDVYQTNWDWPEINVVFVDSNHTYDGVINDIKKVMQLYRDPILVLDDYGNPRQQIKQAIDHLVSEGTIKIEKFIGEREGYTTAHGMVFNGREGVIATTNKQ